MKKLNLETLRVTSFTTSQKSDVRGGNMTVPIQVCYPGYTARPSMCTDAMNVCLAACDDI